MRIKVGTNTWRKVVAVMGERHITLKLKVMCVPPVCMNALETMALTNKQQEKVQVCQNQPGDKNRNSLRSRCEKKG